MCRLWAAEAYNPCMPGPATATVYGFIVFPFMSSPVGEGGQQFRKFTVYVPVRVLTCVCAHCTHMYPDQLVRAQPPRKNQRVNMYVSVCEAPPGQEPGYIAYLQNHFGGSFFSR